MSKMPTIVRVLEYLRHSQRACCPDIISNVSGRQEHIDKALNKLTAEGIITECEGSYSYNATAKAEEFCNKLFAVYDRVIRKPQKELLVRGLLCQRQPQYLFRLNTLLEVSEKEGFAREEVNRFLEEEISNRYVRRVKVIFIRMPAYAAPIYIPFYYMHFRHLSSHDYERHKSRCQESAIPFHEEDYLVGSYPLELSRPAREYLENEKLELRGAIKQKSFGQWSESHYSW